MSFWPLLLLVLASSSAHAQPAPGRPGPYVIDVRGSTVGLPKGPTFFPEVPAAAVVPARAFGIDVGGHVYVREWGASRVGVGASYLFVRGTAPDANATLGILVPQVSFNFGTSNGWSYLSAGVGPARLHSYRVANPLRTRSATSGTVAETLPEPVTVGARTLNFGGGARWFTNRRMAVGFDLRFHKFAGATADPTRVTTPGGMLVAASAGLSFR